MADICATDGFPHTVTANQNKTSKTAFLFHYCEQGE